MSMAPLPESLPVFQPVTVDRSLARNGEAIHAVGIDQRREVVEALSFHARGHGRVVGYVV